MPGSASGSAIRPARRTGHDDKTARCPGPGCCRPAERTAVTEHRVCRLGIESGIALQSTPSVSACPAAWPVLQWLRRQPSCPTNANLRAQARWNCQVSTDRLAELGAQSQIRIINTGEVHHARAGPFEVWSVTKTNHNPTPDYRISTLIS